MNDQNESKYVYVNSIYLNVLIRSSFFKPPVFCIKQKTFEFSNKTVDRKEPLWCYIIIVICYELFCNIKTDSRIFI